MYTNFFDQNERHQDLVSVIRDNGWCFLLVDVQKFAKVKQGCYFFQSLSEPCMFDNVTNLIGLSIEKKRDKKREGKDDKLAREKGNSNTENSLLGQYMDDLFWC